MIDTTKKYPSKLLLFGEHIVLKGAKALAIPYPKFSGNWAYSNDFSKQQNLSAFGDYLQENFISDFHFRSFQRELSKGLYFDSNIPTGYGVGSSGALVAAIYDVFFRKEPKLNKGDLKTYLGKMESFFHGSSSGTDPLVSYLNYPILLGETIQKVALLKEAKTSITHLFLLDTGIKREASPFINGFLERCKDEYYNKQCQSELVPLVDDAIHTFLQGQWTLLFETMHQLSLFQFRYFDFMILENYKKVWLDGLSSDHFKLKICGAGGGGFLLGISKDKEKTKEALKEQTLIWL